MARRRQLADVADGISGHLVRDTPWDRLWPIGEIGRAFDASGDRGFTIDLLLATVDGDESASLAIGAGRRVYVHVARGSVTANGAALAAGDALKLTDARSLELSHGTGAEVLVFDLPGTDH